MENNLSEEDDNSSNNSNNNGRSQKPTFDRPPQKFLEDTDDEDFDQQELEEFSNKNISRNEGAMKAPALKHVNHTVQCDKEPTFAKFSIQEEDSEDSDDSEDIEETPYQKNDLWYLDEDLDDDQLLDIVYENLSKIDGQITYKIFKAQLLPKRRKPSFTEYARLRKFEKLMLKK